MTRYFMRDTPLCQLEQQMMTPPYFKPRGHGRYSPGFQYSSEDTECQYCMNFRRNRPCPLKLCICLDERIMAGALDLNEFVRDCFFPEAGVQLRARLEQDFNCGSIRFSGMSVIVNAGITGVRVVFECRTATWRLCFS